MLTARPIELREANAFVENLYLLASRLGVPAGWLMGEGETFAWEVAE